jgi:Ca2+-binding EF-hand superfamily protein
VFIKGKPLTHEEEFGKKLYLFTYRIQMIFIEYRQAFTLFDHDEDGLINPKELSILIRSLELNPTDNEIQELIDYIVQEGLIRNEIYSKFNFVLYRK